MFDLVNIHITSHYLDAIDDAQYGGLYYFMSYCQPKLFVK